MSTCQIHKKYEWMKCGNAALESDGDGFCLLHSRNVAKDKQLFNDIIVKKLLFRDYDFTGVFFTDVTNFVGINFESSVDFRKAVFSGPTNFIKAKFNGDARFDGSIFLDNTDFNRAEFSGITNFSGATFKKEIYFVANNFEDKVYFYNAKFYNEGSLSLCAFYSNLYFSYVDIYGNITFQADNLPDRNGTRNEFRSDFTFMNIVPGGKIIFQDLSLATSEFYGTDMRCIEFRNVDWYNSFGRKIVYDEILVNRK